MIENIVNTDDEELLTPQQSHVIAALVSGDTTEAAALGAGVTSRTIRRWRQTDANFESALRQHLNAVRDQAENDLIKAASVAVRTLVRIAENPDDPRALKAAESILDRIRLTVRHSLPEDKWGIENEQQQISIMAGLLN